MSSDGFHLWSENYDRTLDDIFAIQDEITDRVAGELATRLVRTASDPGDEVPATAGPGNLVGTADPEAYRFYLRGRHEWRQRNAQALARAIELFREALIAIHASPGPGATWPWP